jgi:diketogulonate reductase-like aldo/keto reductase
MTTTEPLRLTAPLAGGGAIPLVGLGTWQLRGEQARQAVTWALDAGYRHLDTATMYRNEAEVGAAVRDSPVERDEVFLTTKLPPDRADRARATLEASLAALGTDHVDLWLIHWPPDGGAGVATWRDLVAARDEGLARAIGVSNYALDQLDELTRETGVTPEVNQVKWSPKLFDRATYDGHRERGVVLEGYSPFRSGRLSDRVLAGIAERHGTGAAQVVIRWHLQHGVVVIPKSARRERIVDNVDVGGFTLSGDEMAAIDAL